MNKYPNFNSQMNNIGMNDYQHNLTQSISEIYVGINEAAYGHDKRCVKVNQTKGFFKKLVNKLIADLIFLWDGCILSLKLYQFSGCTITLLLYVILFITTPWYFFITRPKVSS